MTVSLPSEITLSTLFFPTLNPFISTPASTPDILDITDSCQKDSPSPSIIESKGMSQGQ
jgi:hypothetical protein